VEPSQLRLEMRGKVGVVNLPIEFDLNPAQVFERKPAKTWAIGEIDKGLSKRIRRGRDLERLDQVSYALFESNHYVIYRTNGPLK
jgi:hypothetical protein